LSYSWPPFDAGDLGKSKWKAEIEGARRVASSIHHSLFTIHAPAFSFSCGLITDAGREKENVARPA
jgi:hypothetical protein